MNRLFPKLVMTVMIGNLLYSTPIATQESPTTKKAARVRISRGPEMERLDPDFAIIRWTSNNPGGFRNRLPRAGVRPQASHNLLLHR